MNRLRIALLSSVLLLRVASAQAGTVAIVRLPTKTPDLTEALSRLHGELLSVGLEVKMIDRPAERALGRRDARTWLQQKATEAGIDAIIEIVGEVTPVEVDIWVIEKAPERLEFSRVLVEPNATNASERLAIRAVEVLRSTFLENDMALSQRYEEPRQRPTPSRAPPPRDHDEPANHLERFGVEVGAATLTSLDHVGPSISPMARFDWAVRPWLAAQLQFAGFGSRPTVATTVGEVRIAQQFALLGGCYRFRPNHGFRPFFALSAGVLRTSLEGRADAPRQGHGMDQWSLLGDASLGTELRLADRYFVTLAAHVQVANPYVAIHIADRVAGTSGRPNFVLTLTVGAWL